MCKNGLDRVVVLGASFFAGLFVIAHALRHSDPSSLATTLVGVMSFALAVLIEDDGGESRPTFLLHAVRPVAKTPSSASERNGPAGVAELVDALDLGSSDSRRGGSSPSARTISIGHGVRHGPRTARSARGLGSAVKAAASFSLLSAAETVIRL